MQTDNLKSKNTYLGVDWGAKRIGLALGDSETRVVTPYKTVSNASEVSAVVINDKVDVVVVGAPYSITDRELRATKGFHNFINELRSLVKCPIELYDESLTSKAADKLPGNKKFKAGRDALAAMLILQSYLDSLKK